MKLFSKGYDRMILWSSHPHARYYLAGVSFAESSFFPIPPDIMLISMGLARPDRAWLYAWIATLCSVLGGILGYGIGFFCMNQLEPWLLHSHYAESYQHIRNWFEHADLLMVIFAGFSPFPYKIFTIAAGAMAMPFGSLFVLGSCLGRGLRFFMVSSLSCFVGHRLEKQIRRSMDVLGWIGVIGVMGFLCLKWLQ